MNTFLNPILPGFYPDPSICRVGEDYYLVNSSFEYFPCIPIFHSRDLVHWRQIGHVIARASQLDMTDCDCSGGSWAPTIRHHGGKFYVANTMFAGKRGNFVATADDPAGPWSDPHWIEDAPDIDPSVFFDDDGTCWFAAMQYLPNPKWSGEARIWLQELDLKAMKLVGARHDLWGGALLGALATEGPHIYKVDGWYYLLVAEGGTFHNHAVTIARSRNITGPYEGNARNPILTHRHLGLDYPIVGTGHADMVQTQNGDWWMVCLGMRPYGGYFHNLGRETFLTPVRWEEGWPIVSPGTGRVEFEYPCPSLPTCRWPTTPACDNFDSPKLALQWNFLRTPSAESWSLSDRPGFLRLKLRPQTIMEKVHPSFVGRRQQHRNFTARAAMEFTPKHANECAGVVVLQNTNFMFRLEVTRAPSGDSMVRLIKRKEGTEETLCAQAIGPGRIYMKVEARSQEYSFWVSDAPDAWLPVIEKADGRILSTQVATGFVGAYIGMYASSNSQPGGSVADFDWFEYLPMD
jgi:alpha-N-arabinofuranosidase